MLNYSRSRLALAALIVGLLSLLVVAPADAAETQLTTKARRAILMDAETGAVLFQKNADELAPPASMSKLMTLAVLFRAIKSGQIKLTDEFVVSVHAWRHGGAPSGTSAMMIPVNTKESVEDLIQGIIVASGNDASICIAEGMAGSEQAFAHMMTTEARRIGLTRSTFANATGLDNPRQLMTAREIAMLARYVIKEYPKLYSYFAQKEFRYRKHRFINRNPLLFANVGADGIKTGHIAASGYSLVGSAVQDGRRLIVVVGGLDKASERRNEAVKLLNVGFKSFVPMRIFDEGEVIGDARVWGGETWYVPLGAKGPVMFTLPKYPANQKISAEIVYKAPLKPPVKKGDQVATLKLSSSTSAATEVPLYAMADDPAAGTMSQGLDSLVLMALRRLAF